MSNIISDPELLFEVSRIGTSKNDRLAAIKQLYSQHYPAVCEAEKAMEKAHTGFVEIISPVSAELFERLRAGRVIDGDDFHQNFCLRSEWMLAQMRSLRHAYERQYGSAHNLVNML